MSPKRRARRLCVRDIDFLVAKEDDAMLEQGLADVADDAVIEIGGKVDAADLGTNGSRQGFDRQLHGGAVSLVKRP